MSASGLPGQQTTGLSQQDIWSPDGGGCRVKKEKGADIPVFADGRVSERARSASMSRPGRRSELVRFVHLGFSLPL
jgi:hypothetical protein